jgi:indolepyruvate ferredoxin oxidoreductase
LIDELLGKLAADNHGVAMQLASLPEEIRGYGHIKEKNLSATRAKWTDQLARFRGQQSAQVIRMPSKVA